MSLFRLNIKHHRLTDIPFFASPFFNERPTQNISLLVIHCISLPAKKYGGDYVRALFTNQINPNENALCKELATYQVSAHVFIRRDGQLQQFVPFDKRAWHAGQSQFKGQDNCNDFSIGIELEGAEDDYFTKAQYQALADITPLLLDAYPIEAIVGHEDIAPTRKTDPGKCFNWNYYQQLLKRSPNLFVNI